MTGMDKTFTAINDAEIAAGESAESAVISVYGVRSIMLTMRKTGDSALVTYYVYTSPDGTEIDTEPYQTFAIAAGGAKQISRPVTVGSRYIKLKATNGGSASCGATVKFVPVYGR